MAWDEKYVTANSLHSYEDTLYLGGWETHAITKILADGTIVPFLGQHRFAGHTDGPAASALLFNVVGMTQLGRELYFSNGSTLRKVNLDTNTVSTVIGTTGVYGSSDGVGAAVSFSGIDTIVSDGTYIYINDRNNHLVRRMNVSTLEVVTIGGIAGVSGTTDGELGVGTLNSPSKIMYLDGSVYVSDMGNHLIRKIEGANTSSPVLKTVLGQVGVSGYSESGVGTQATLSSPVGLTTDGKFGYFLNTGSHVLQRFDPKTFQLKTIIGKEGQSGMVEGNLETARLIDAGHDIFMTPFGIIIGGGSTMIRIH